MIFIYLDVSSICQESDNEKDKDESGAPGSGKAKKKKKKKKKVEDTGPSAQVRILPEVIKKNKKQLLLFMEYIGESVSDSATGEGRKHCDTDTEHDSKRPSCHSRGESSVFKYSPDCLL